MAQWSGLYSPSNPVKLTILAAMWDSNFLAIFTAQLAKQLILPKQPLKAYKSVCLFQEMQTSINGV